MNPGLLGRGLCSPSDLQHCPPTHTFLNGSVVSKSDQARFPYRCYWYYCAPPGTTLPETATCDAYSNPNPQELVQLLPCEEWSQWGFPHPGEGWVGDARQWGDGRGRAGQHAPLLLQSAAARPSIRRWVSMEVGPEVFQPMQTAEWSISHWDITVNASAPLGSESRSQSVRFTRPQPTRSE